MRWDVTGGRIFGTFGSMKFFPVLTVCCLSFFCMGAQESGEKERAAAAKETKEQTTARLKAKVFPKVEFKDSMVSECADWLTTQGLEVVLAPGLADAVVNTRITLSLRNVPAYEVLLYVTNLSNLKFEVVEGKVVLMPLVR
jgi:hypothetical protein